MKKQLFLLALLLLVCLRSARLLPISRLPGLLPWRPIPLAFP